MLLDSNIIIYSVQPENAHIRQLIADHNPAVSALSYLEVLGYHRLTQTDRLYFEQFFQVAQVVPISQIVIEQAVLLRQMRRITLGDAIIGGTAIVHNLNLVTRNTEDFRYFTQLRLLNTFEANTI
ncbi:PIN domain-containing protein [Nostoc sp. B(2019)]|nr:PIN domain-containing protein [Nostoc sp. B(2019)]